MAEVGIMAPISGPAADFIKGFINKCGRCGQGIFKDRALCQSCADKAKPNLNDILKKLMK
jgi:hypothetical protein